MSCRARPSNTANADIFYDLGPVEIKLAGYYTSRVLFSPSLVTPSGSQDAYQDPRKLVDLGANYQVAEHANIYLNARQEPHQ